MKPIAYTFEADYHCPVCTSLRFGYYCEGTDREGNEVGAVFPWDEWWEPTEEETQGLSCSDCGTLIDTWRKND